MNLTRDCFTISWVMRIVDWVVMKSLEKDRTRRYETPLELARDVARFLSGEVVVARPPGRAYLLRKFVQRHRAAIAVSAVIVTALALGLVLASVGFVQASRQRADHAALEPHRPSGAILAW